MPSSRQRSARRRRTPLRSVRVAVLPLALAAVVLALVGGPAAAAPRSGSSICIVSADAPEGISGLVATKEGYTVVSDTDQSPLKLVLLTSKCAVSKVIRSSADPRNPEDLARTPDGTYWVADIGDNTRERSTIAVHSVKTSGATALYRVSYPDGAKDAEAMIMPADKKPVIITKNPLGPAGVYVATAALTTQKTVPLKKIGEMTIPATGTAGGPVGRVGQTVVTGAALSPDGKHLAVRTYTDVYEWAVSTDVATTLTSGKLLAPIAVSDEPQGEAVSYTTDGAALLTLSEGSEQPIKYWTRQKDAAPASSPAVAGDDSGGGFALPDVGLTGLAALVAGVGVLGLVLLLVGIAGIRRSRRRTPLPPSGGRGRGQRDLDPYGDGPSRGGTRRSSAEVTAEVMRQRRNGPPRDGRVPQDGRRGAPLMSEGSSGDVGSGARRRPPTDSAGLPDPYGSGRRGAERPEAADGGGYFNAGGYSSDGPWSSRSGSRTTERGTVYGSSRVDRDN